MTTDGLARYGADWMARWREISSIAPLVPVIGRQFTCTFLVGFGTNECIVEMFQGRIGRIDSVDRRLGGPLSWQFAIRGPTSLWDKFLMKDPPPGCLDIWGMNYPPVHPDSGSLVVEGDVLVVRQHNRALQYILDLLRSVEST